MNVKNMYIIKSNHIRVCYCYCYCLLIIPWIYDQGYRLSSSEHQRAYMEDIHEQVWICTERDGNIIWGKGLHVEHVFAGGDVYNLW